METIIVKPRSATESKAIRDFLKKKKIKAVVYKETTKKQILKNIENGAKATQLYLKGKLKLKEAKNLFDEI